jgi:DNA primase
MPGINYGPIIDDLQCGKGACQCRRGSNGSRLVHCPAHHDDRPSLSVKEDGDKVLFHCHASCSQDAVLDALKRRGLWPPNGTNGNQRVIDQTFPYLDSNGRLIFEAVRYRTKGFSQRRPDGKGGYIYDLNGVQPILYRMPQLLAAKPHEPIFIPEGEKHADRLAALGLVATTFPMGAGKSHLVQNVSALKGRDVVVLPDNDEPGYKHGRQVAERLAPDARSTKVLDLPGLKDKGDVLDWLAAGHTVDELLELAQECQEWTPPTSEEVDDGREDGGDDDEGDKNGKQAALIVELAKDLEL